MTAAQTTVVIVNWNGAAYLDQLIQSIQREKPAKIVIVDNSSTDSSITILQKFGDVHVIQNSDNRGFAAAANQGIALANTSNVLILNADVYGTAGSIIALGKFLGEKNDAGAVAPRLSFPDGSLQLSCRNFPTPFTLFLYLSFLDRIIPTKYRLRAKDHQSTCSVQQPMGAAIMIRKKVLDQIGGFDETFFLYMEDVDLCERIIREGWKIYYYPTAEFIHDSGGSSRQDWYRSQADFVRSALLYFRKKGYQPIFVKIALASSFIIRAIVYFFTGNLHRMTDSLKLAGRSLEKM
ncbi:glycosyltransferase family 2 protein [bacterium]|nr:glycosyltransferase family 2 protein [bacterium]